MPEMCVREDMLSWKYKNAHQIEVTDGRKRMYLSLSVIPELDIWFTKGTSAYTFNSYQNIITPDAPLLTWHGFGDMPVVGTVRKTVRWPRKEVQQIVRAIYVAERLRAQSEPHTLYIDLMGGIV